MEQTARNASFLIALFTLGLTSAHAQPAFLRKDIQVPGQYKYYAIQVQTGGIVVGDFNGDGRPDLVVASQGGIDVLLNSGGGNFGRPIHTEQSGVPVTADVNGDGKLDLVLSGHLLLGRGDGTFLPPRDMPGVVVAAAGDFNNDGRVDLLTYGRVLLGNGDGTFRPGGEILQGAPSQTNQLAIADFNRDGRVDVAVNYGDPWIGYTVSIFLGNGDGSFQSPVSTQVGAATLLAADFNGDGLPDLITGYDILLGNGDGSFQAPHAYFTPQNNADLPVPLADLSR